jgi:hypothetical protein
VPANRKTVELSRANPQAGSLRHVAQMLANQKTVDLSRRTRRLQACATQPSHPGCGLRGLPAAHFKNNAWIRPAES